MHTTTLQRTLIVCALAGMLALAVALLAAKTASAAPPGPIPFPNTTERGICEFPVRVHTTGRSKVIETGSGDVLFTNPGLRVTLTNLDEPANTVTYRDSGPVRVTELEGGEVLLVLTGRNVVYSKSIGMFLAIGHFSTIVDEEGNFTPLSGNGRLIDICARLA
jgi:hypothetical protein